MSATAKTGGNVVAGFFTYSATPARGTASAVTSASVLSAGTYTLTASFAPSNATTYSAACATVSLTVAQASQTISFTQPASPVTYGVVALALSATSTSSLPVTFSVVSGPGTISGKELTITGAGNIVVGANEAGTASYSAAAQVLQTIVGKATPIEGNDSDTEYAGPGALRGQCSI